jgi:hypothetical protein
VDSTDQHRGFMDRRRVNGWEVSVHRKNRITIDTKVIVGDSEFAEV